MQIKFIGLVLSAVLSTAVYAQTAPAKPTPTKDVVVNSSAAEDSLKAIYKDLSDTKKKADVELQQARSILDAKNKPIQAKIDPLQKEIEANNTEASQKYQATVSPLYATTQKDTAQIQALEAVVRKEQALPANATFDLEKGKWIVPDDKPEVKK